MAVKPKIARWPVSVVDPGFYTTRWDVNRGSGQVVLIEGEAGAGKSRLVAEVLSEADGRGVPTLYGAVEELERDRPLGALAQALALDRPPLDDERARIHQLLLGDEAGILSPSLAGSQELRFRLLDAVTSVVEELAEQRPIFSWWRIFTGRTRSPSSPSTT